MVSPFHLRGGTEMDEWIYIDVDFGKCKRVQELHEELKQKLELPDFYGCNYAALWDSITGIMYTPAYVTIHGVDEVPQELRSTVDKMIEIFRRAEAMYGDIRVQVGEERLGRMVSPFHLRGGTEMDEWIHIDLDFGKCKRAQELHEELKQKLELPDFYGRNLDALWDSITGIMYTPACVTIHGVDKAPQDLRSTVDKMIEIFRRAEAMYGDVRVQVAE